jgi:hypothetical protein
MKKRNHTAIAKKVARVRKRMKLARLEKDYRRILPCPNFGVRNDQRR